MLFIFLLSLDKVEIPLITFFEDRMFESNQRLIFNLLFLKLVKIVHIELNLIKNYLSDKGCKITVSEILREYNFL